MTRTGVFALLAALLLAGCASHYGSFTLPPLSGPAVSPVLVWEVHPEPVLTRGAAGEFDAVDALNPSVVSYENKLYNLYSGYDGKTWHTGLATSLDGLHWARKGRVLSPDGATWEGDYITANGSALHIGKAFFYWYQGGRKPSIGLATSLDATAWLKQAKPVLQPGPTGSWDEMGVADPYVLQIGDTLYMYYLGQDRAKRQRLGLARSKDGLQWEKLVTNPILELGEANAFDEIGLGEPAVWQSRDSYWMLYTGRDRAENRRLGLARSQDGVHWTRVADGGLSGNLPWNSKVVCDPTVLVEGNRVRVWFGGGDQPQPAEHLDGQIGYAVLTIGK